jgi:hypothetical protein
MHDLDSALCVERNPASTNDPFPWCVERTRSIDQVSSGEIKIVAMRREVKRKKEFFEYAKKNSSTRALVDVGWRSEGTGVVSQAYQFKGVSQFGDSRSGVDRIVMKSKIAAERFGMNFVRAAWRWRSPPLQWIEIVDHSSRSHAQVLETRFYIMLRHLRMLIQAGWWLSAATGRMAAAVSQSITLGSERRAGFGGRRPSASRVEGTGA